MSDAGNIFQLKLTLTNSFPKVWRRVLVPDGCTLSDLHYVISYSFGWFQDAEHEFSRGSRVFGSILKPPARPREDDNEAFLVDVFKRPGTNMRYVYQSRDEWRVQVVYEGDQAPVPRGEYPCCIAGENDGPPDGVGGIHQYNEAVHAANNADAWAALCARLGPSEWQLAFEPTYLDIGDINCSLGLIFHELELSHAPPTDKPSITRHSNGHAPPKARLN
ncbi:MAG: plasmid pRiA4b ORF-3 family protein [Myxococcota bacterium]